MGEHLIYIYSNRSKSIPDSYIFMYVIITNKIHKKLMHFIITFLYYTKQNSNQIIIRRKKLSRQSELCKLCHHF